MVDEWLIESEESIVEVSIFPVKVKGRKRKPKVLRMINDVHAETFCLAVSKASGLSPYQSVDALQKIWKSTPDPDELTAELKHYMALVCRPRALILNMEVLRGSYAG